MAIFNSLGSNYSPGFILESLLGFSFNIAKKPLADELGKYYGGNATLTYKGRQALELALKQSGLPAGSKIGINGFTCYVVYQAVVNSGLAPVLLDVSPGSLNFGVNELVKAKGLKAVIVQNTLGYPADMPAIKNHCDKNKILIIEDLAHSLGAKYGDDTEAGLAGDFTMLSFSQDKPLDVVAGGALIDRRLKPANIHRLPGIGIGARFKNRFYPFWTGLIRLTYPIGVGRYLHGGLKKLHALSTPMNDNLEGIQTMTSKSAMLLLGRWNRRVQEAAHRQNIAAIYEANLPKDIKIKPLAGSLPLYLRFPVLVPDRQAVVGCLKQSGIYIGDTWYDVPIAPSRYMEKTNYKAGECPEAEKLCGEIVNLPTHINVSEKQAKVIAQKVSQCLLK